MPSHVRRRQGRSLSVASFSLVFAVFLLLSTSLAVGVAHQLHQLSLHRLGQTVTPKYLVMLVLDGARPSYLDLGPLPHLDALRQDGMQYDRAFAGILESETPSGHAALATGSTPAHDGLLGFNWITSDNTTVHLFDPGTVRAGGIEHVLQASGASTIASLFKARFPRAKVVAVSGHKYYAADPLGGPDADYIMYYANTAKNTYAPTAIPGHVPPASILNASGLAAPAAGLPPGTEDSLAVKLAMASFARVHQQVTLINLPEFDWPLGHVYGGETARARKLMQDFDRDLGTIEDTYRRAGVLDQTIFVVTADHGMADLRYQVPDAVLDDAVTAAGTTSPETTYSTAGYIWLQDASLAPVVAGNVLHAANPHIQSVYYRVRSGSADGYVLAAGQHVSPGTDAANQYLLSSFLGGNAPDVVVFCSEDTAFVTKGAETWKGNHGGAAWGSQHMPLIISGPGVVSGVISHAPARLEDIAPTVLDLFGIKAMGMQGTVLADALAAPTAGERRSQAALTRTLDPVVNSLAAQSQRDIAAETAR
jgi:predicted AlkP superfamily pyrophosphatase or phosphodiesterase